MKKHVIKDLLLVVAGNFILASGVAFFIIPNNILSGGVAGVSVALSAVIPLSITTLINVLTVVFFILGSVVLGKGFALKTMVSTVLYPSFVSILTVFSSSIEITDDPILASLYGGALIGSGLGMVLKTGASTGGMDVPPIIAHKYTHIHLSKLIFITDGFTVLLGMSIYGIEAALIGLLSVLSASFMVNKAMMMGMAEAKSIMIISDKNDLIYEEISKEVQRGGTILNAKGAYTKDDKEVLVIIVLKKQFPLANRIIASIDPNAFIVINDVKEVKGEGFTFDEI